MVGRAKVQKSVTSLARGVDLSSQVFLHLSNFVNGVPEGVIHGLSIEPKDLVVESVLFDRDADNLPVVVGNVVMTFEPLTEFAAGLLHFQKFVNVHSIAPERNLG